MPSPKLICCALVLVASVLAPATPAAAQDEGVSPAPILQSLPPIDHPLPASVVAAGDATAAPHGLLTAPGGEAELNHIYTREHQATVPFGPAALEAARQAAPSSEAVVLYVSGNRGQSWVRTQKRALPTAGLQFEAANDGEFWCVFRGEAADQSGPAPAAGTRPDYKVTVAAAPPEVKELSALPSHGGEPLALAWRVEDLAPLVGVTAVATSAGSSQTLKTADSTADSAGAGRTNFAALAAGAWKIKITFEDLAGNVASRTLDLTVSEPPVAKRPAATAEPAPVLPAGEGAAIAARAVPPLPGEQIEPAGAVRSRDPVSFLASRTLTIGYRWDKDHPPSRLGLWVTRDGGRSWHLDQTAAQLTGSFTYRADEDGAYGFSIHRELGDQSWGVPHSGDAPEREVIVVTTPPRVTWLGPLGPATADPAVVLPANVAGMAKLQWKTINGYPAEKPVTLEYRAFRGTQWHALAGPLVDLGEFEWKIPATLRGPIEVRVTAVDRVGHAAAAMLPLDVAPAPVALAASTGQLPQAGAESKDEARRAYAMATLARIQDNWKGAEEQLARATVLDPDYGAAWSDLGGVYLHDGRWEPAVDAYRYAVALLPQSTNARLGLARAQAGRGDLDAANASLQTLVTQDPADGDAWVLYGKTLWKAGDHAKARQCWLKAMGLGGAQTANLAEVQRLLKLKD
jgi:predicted negative regulator of RcsB-dependent stress response